MSRDLPRSALKRYELAERQGLRLAIFCRTMIALSGLIYLVTVYNSTDYTLRIWTIVALFAYAATGFTHLAIVGTRYDRWWLKYAVSAFDMIGICALFAIIPVSRSSDIPQIIAFRAYGIYYLFPILALSVLSLSWRLVVWTGAVAVVAWWSAFLWVISNMDQTLSWSDIPVNATTADYENLFLSINFVGTGNRVEESGFLLAGAFILALVVFRARTVFLAQIKAEAQERKERQARHKVTAVLGRFVPEEITNQLIADSGTLAPKEGHGTLLVLDIQDFTGFARDKSPTVVIEALDGFLARCCEVIAENSGVVITFTGDGLLASFNTPLKVDDPEAAAYDAAVALVAAADSLNFTVRIGVASGPVASGSIGSSDRMAFTVYGTTVNRAARLETLCKSLNQTILIDRPTREKLTGARSATPQGDHGLRGLDEPVSVFAVTPEQGEWDGRIPSSFNQTLDSRTTT